MNLQQFLKKLRTVKNSCEWYVTKSGTIYGLAKNHRCVFCPITCVGYYNFKKKYAASQYDSCAANIGLNETSAETIIEANDNMRGCESSVRKTLFKILQPKASRLNNIQELNLPW